MGVGYTSVSQERKKLRDRLVQDPILDKMIKRLEEGLSIIKI
jgi:hypothetical protein